MQSHIVKRTQRPAAQSLRRQRSLRSQDGLRSSSIAERASESSQARTLLASRNKIYSRSTSKNYAPPYEGFVREMRIKLPTPKEKFYQFLKIQPFNRIQSHNELIALFLKNLQFFKLHQLPIVQNLARKVRLVELQQLQEKMLVVTLQGECVYQGKVISAGMLVNRKSLIIGDLSVDNGCKLLAISRHQYQSFLSSYIHQELFKFKEFINSIQLFKMFSEKTIQKLTEGMSLHYYLRGQRLYSVGDEANLLYVMVSGKASRRVVIEIQKVNKIPLRRFQREVRILSKSYSHQIEFGKEQLIGVTEIIDKVAYRKQQIELEQDSVLLGMERNVIQQSLDDYIAGRLKKYNLKKYPANYDQLCGNYQKEKKQQQRTEERKILALQNELKLQQNDRRQQKIQAIIKIYEHNIKLMDSKNLLTKKLHFEVDYYK